MRPCLICQHLTDDVESQQHTQEKSLLDLPELEIIVVDQVRINRIPQVSHTCAVLSSLYCISIILD